MKTSPSRATWMVGVSCRTSRDGSSHAEAAETVSIPKEAPIFIILAAVLSLIMSVLSLEVMAKKLGIPNDVIDHCGPK